MWVSIGESSAFPAAPWMVEPRDKIVPGGAGAALAAPAPGIAVTGDLDAIMDRCATGDDRAFDELYRRGAQRVRGFLFDCRGLRARRRPHAGDVRADSSRTGELCDRRLGAALDVRDRAQRVPRSRPARAGASQARAPVSRNRERPRRTREGDEVLAGREMLGVVRQTLERLPDVQRDAFVLIRFEGLSVSEAAQILGATEAAVKVRAFRAYEALRAALDLAGAGPDGRADGERDRERERGSRAGRR